MADDEGRDSPPSRWKNYPWLVASGLLVLAIGVFVVSHLVDAPSFGVRLLQRISEASLIGGIADWFAVTALFRHPFGLPIPHTAVIPRSKDRIGVGLGSFAERHLFDPDSVTRKVRSADLPGKAARWLSNRDNAETVADRLTQALAFFVAALPDTELRGFVRRLARRQLSALDPVPIVAAIVEALRESGRHQDLFDHLISAVRDYLVGHRRHLKAEIEARTAWWVPKAVDRRMTGVLIDQAIVALGELLTPESGVRRDFDRAAAALIDDLNRSPAYRQQIEAFQRELLTSPSIDAELDRLADDLRRALSDDVADKRSAIRAAITDSLVGFANRLVENDADRARIERRLIWVVRSLIVPWRQDIGRFVTEVVHSWDARTVSQRLEEAVGNDLQYIRVNGTLVGGMVGGLIFLVSEALF